MRLTIKTLDGCHEETYENVVRMVGDESFLSIYTPDFIRYYHHDTPVSWRLEVATEPVQMLLYCPYCYEQHIDEVDEVNNPGWENPPHHKHKCLFCGGVWQPSNTNTEGVRNLSSPTEGETMSYHITPIEKGVYGEASKVREETEEFLDAVEQNNPVMALVELTDLAGAMKGYLEKYHPTVTMEHVLTMATATQKAFVDGTRT